MALTIGYALQNFEIFASARVVAGHGGLDREIHWAHILDLPEITPWVRQGDLLMTTAFALKDEPQTLVELIPTLAQKGLAGVVVALGPYFNRIPDEMVAVADHLDFPIITLPWEVPFVEVTQVVHEYILRQQYAHIEKSLEIHDVLTRLVLEGKTLEDLVLSLAGLLTRAVTIEDHSMRMLAYASPGPIDELRRNTIETGRTPPALVDYLEKSGLFAALREDPRPHPVPPVPELGMTYERTVAPIVVGGNLLGYVWIVATEDSPLTKLDFLAIEHAATVAALVLTRQQAVFEAEQRVKAALLENLLELDPYRDGRVLNETILKLGLNRGFQVLAIEENSEQPLGPLALANLIEAEGAQDGLQITVVQRLNKIIVLLGTPEQGKGKRFAESLVQAAEAQRATLVAGIGRWACEDRLARQCYMEAAEALRIGKVLSQGKSGVWEFENLGFLQWSNTLPSDLLLSSSYFQTIQRMAIHDQVENDFCLPTLEAYLDHSGNKQRVADALYIHRNTLRQRMQKIQELWGIDWENQYMLMNLYIAIKQWRLAEGG